MRAPALLSLFGIPLAAAACGGGTTDLTATATLYAVNGARHAAVFPGDTATWGGYGFGTEPGMGLVRVLTARGPDTAAIAEWRDAAVRGVLPDDVQSGPTVLLTSSDSLGPLDVFVRTRTTYDPATRTWAADATLPLAITDAAVGALRFPGTASLGTRLVLNGGRLEDGTLNRTTYLGTVDAAGRVGGWQEAPDTIVPIGRRLHALVGADRTTAVLDAVDGVAYMIGGLDSADRVLADVVGLGVTADGGYGFWTALSSLPDRRAGATAVAAYSKLYVVGGFGSDSLASRGVAYATVQPSGALNGWLLGPPLPEGRAFAAAAIAGSMLLVLGGERGLVDPDAIPDSAQLTATVYAIRVSPLSGAFQDTAWTVLPVTLRQARSRAAAFVTGDAVVVTGGTYLGMPSSAETEYAVLFDGLPGDFQEYPGTTLADLAGGPVWAAAAPIVWDASGVGRVTLIGGMVAGTPSARTWSQ